MANIRDIAKITGYSVSTISRVLNDYPYVEEKKRQKVLAVMKELNYVPNRTARNLSYGKTRNIGVVLPFTDHPYFDQLLQGIIEAAFAEGYKVTLLPTNYDRKIEKSYLEEFAAKSFDGLIVTSRANPSDYFKSYLDQGPIIFCDDIPLEKASCAYIDRKRSLKEALLYLKTQGVERIGVTLGRSKKQSYNSKITIQLCQEIFTDFSEEQVFWNCLTAADGRRAAAFFKKQQIDGILTNGDEVAAAIIDESFEKAPLVIGRENLLISQIMNFSTIDHHLKECGKTAFRLFYEEKIEKIKIPYEFIRR